MRTVAMMYLIVFSMLFVGKCGLLQDLQEQLPSTVQEIDQTIMKDFVKEYQHTKDIRNSKQLKSYYDVYKVEWKKRMVEFLIQQLGISGENAKEAKKNPESYFINYDTYKLFKNVK